MAIEGQLSELMLDDPLVEVEVKAAVAEAVLLLPEPLAQLEHHLLHLLQQLLDRVGATLSAAILPGLDDLDELIAQNGSL